MKSGIVFLFACLLQTGIAHPNTPDSAAIDRYWKANADSASTASRIAAINRVHPGFIDPPKMLRLIVLGTWLDNNHFYDAYGEDQGEIRDFDSAGEFTERFANRIAESDSASASLGRFNKYRNASVTASILSVQAVAFLGLAGMLYLFDRAGNDPPKTHAGYYAAAGGVASIVGLGFTFGYNSASSRQFQEAVRRYNISIILRTF